MVVGLCSPKRCTGPQGLACLGRRHDKTKGLCCGRQLSDQSTARRVMAVVQGLLQNEHRQAEKDLAFASPQVWRLRDQQRPTEASVSSSKRVCLGRTPASTVALALIMSLCLTFPWTQEGHSIHVSSAVLQDENNIGAGFLFWTGELTASLSQLGWFS